MAERSVAGRGATAATALTAAGLAFGRPLIVMLDPHDRKNDDGCRFRACCNVPATAPRTCSVGKTHDDTHLPFPPPRSEPRQPLSAQLFQIRALQG
jgi:hypothetical protein